MQVVDHVRHTGKVVSPSWPTLLRHACRQQMQTTHSFTLSVNTECLHVLGLRLL